MIVVLMGNWRTLALRAIAALAFGILALAWPRLTLTALVLLWGVFVLVDGVTILAQVARDRAAEHRWARVLMGVVSVAAGLITVAWPGITALALLMVIAAWAFLTGAIEIAAAIRLRRELHHEWLLVFAGMLAIGVAAALVISPAAGALAITWLIGWFAIIYGVVRLMLAWRLRQFEAAVQPVERRPAESRAA
jgi:uncharacterized membrane protein HdeD (DUF308 family)